MNKDLQLIKPGENLPQQKKVKEGKYWKALEKFYVEGHDKASLSPTEWAMVERFRFIGGMMSKFHTRRVIVKTLIKKYEISEQAAYNSYRTAVNFYGSMDDIDKEAERFFLKEWITKALRRTWKQGNMKEFTRLIGEYRRVTRMEQTEISIFTPKDLENNEWFESFPQEFVDGLAKLLKTKGTIDISEVFASHASDAEIIEHDLDEEE